MKRSLEQTLRRLEQSSQDDEIQRNVSDPDLATFPESETDFGGRLTRPIHIVEHYTYISVADGEDIRIVELKSSLNSLKAYLPAPAFAQPHRSYVVNTSHVSGIKK